MNSTWGGGSEAGSAEVRLPRPPGMMRRAFAAHPVAVDVFIAAWYLIGVGIGVMLDSVATGTAASVESTGTVTMTSWIGVPSYLEWPWWPLQVIRVCAVAAALLLRRHMPLAGLVTVLIASLGYHGIQSIATGVAVLFLLYAVPVYRGVAAAWVGYGLAMIVTICSYWASPIGAEEATPGGVLFAATVTDRSFGDFVLMTVMTGIWYLAIVMLGINLGNRRRYIAAVIDRAHQLARERDQLAQLAVAEERSRIAREMHDIVAHSVSVMIALSEGASRVAETAPAAAADAMQRSAETGRTALAEMRRLLGALHAEDESAAYVPQPGVEQLPQLITGFREAGLTVALDISGGDAGDKGQDLAVYRVAQEGLTNVLRYAGTGARAEVTVARLPDRTVVEVRDFGPAVGAQPPVTGVGSGRGLAGLAERVRVFGGRIESGAIPAQHGGGWRLWAELPLGIGTGDPSSAGEAAPAGAPARSDELSRADASTYAPITEQETTP